MNLEIGQVLTQILAFLLVVWVLKRFAWKPLLSVLEERKNKIASEFDLIDVEKKKAAALTSQYEEKLKGIEAEARTKIAEAVAEGRKVAQEIQTQARQEAQEVITKAQSEVAREIEKAKVQLKNDMVNLSLLAAEKMIREKLDPAKHKQLIAEFVDQADFK